jgi:hypothetical protein
MDICYKKGRIYVNGEQDGTTATGGTADALRIDKNDNVAMSNKDSAFKYLERYDLKASIRTTYSEAMKAIDVTYKSAQSYYHFVFNNCGHAVADGLEAIGVYGGSSWQPNIRYLEMLNGHRFYR